MLREILSKEIAKAAGIKADDVKVFEPERAENGDYTTNVAFALSKKLKRNPQEVAEELAKKLASLKLVERAEAKNGFLNIFIKDAALLEELEKEIEFPKKKEKFSVEYLDANPTGPVHLGHARSGFWGDVLSNILQSVGYQVTREFLVNNAKASLQIRSLGKTALGKGEEYKHDQLLSLLQDEEVKAELKKCKDEREAGFYIAGLIHEENKKFLAERTGIKFDVFFEEESVYQSGEVERVLKIFKEKNIAYEKDGALWFRAKDYGDTEDKVLVRSTGEPTYLLPDIAYHLDRLVKRKCDRLIDIFGADHHGYSPRLVGALQAFGIDVERIQIINIQNMRLISEGKEVKMSKRKGLFITLEELIDEVELDVTRWFFLERSPNTHMDFDFDLAKEKSEKNPVYYVQYAHTRMVSILQKSSAKSQKLKNFGAPAERELIVKILRYPEILEDISKDYQVHRLTTYAYELAQTFSAFYRDVKVIGSEREAELLYLIFKTKETLADLLKLLGIFRPEKM